MLTPRQLIRALGLFPETPNRSVTITSTGLAAFRRYIRGEISLAEFRATDCTTITKAIDSDEPRGS